MQLDFIPKSSINTRDTCQIYVQEKQPNKPHKYVSRDNKLPKLIHSDICDNNYVLTRGGNQYFITFINDFSEYFYILFNKI